MIRLCKFILACYGSTSNPKGSRSLFTGHDLIALACNKLSKSPAPNDIHVGVSGSLVRARAMQAEIYAASFTVYGIKVTVNFIMIF